MAVWDKNRFLRDMLVQLIGESCVDVYVYGRCPRLSPEAPVPVFIETRRVKVPGMAGNVLCNLRALGVDAVFETQKTPITKTRFVEETRNHPLLRVDEDGRTMPVYEGSFDPKLPLVVSDYNKGFLLDGHLSMSHEGLSFIDTKRPLDEWAKRFTFIKLNKHEYEANYAYTEANKAWLAEKLIVTLGQDGALYKGEHFAVRQAHVFDVTGAGDSFFAAFVAHYLKNRDTRTAIFFANECARSVVMERGTTVIAPGFATQI